MELNNPTAAVKTPTQKAEGISEDFPVAPTNETEVVDNLDDDVDNVDADTEYQALDAAAKELLEKAGFDDDTEADIDSHLGAIDRDNDEDEDEDEDVDEGSLLDIMADELPDESDDDENEFDPADLE